MSIKCSSKAQAFSVAQMQSLHAPYLPPPPVAHKVWILDCKSCGVFLTNRAMKAVLLLRPNVSLFSSDASPVNCSAYSPDSDAHPSASGCRPAPSRTCDCLTQTLCCHGCGNPVGYMIVIPCTRCTSSISTSNRATNGHRFVFHSSEISGTERHYVPNEPGVTPYEPIAFVAPALVVPSQQTPFPPHSYPRPTPPADHPPLEYPTHLAPASFSSPETYYTTMGQPPTYHVSHTYAYASTHGGFTRHPAGTPPPLPHRVYQPITQIPPPEFADSREGPAFPDAGLFEHKEPLFTPRHLKAGDVLFWHHLTRSGEIPCAQNDERARHPISPLADNPLGIVFDR